MTKLYVLEPSDYKADAGFSVASAADLITALQANEAVRAEVLRTVITNLSSPERTLLLIDCVEDSSALGQMRARAEAAEASLADYKSALESEKSATGHLSRQLTEALARAEAAKAKLTKLSLESVSVAAKLKASEQECQRLRGQLAAVKLDLLDIAQSTRGNWESRSEAGGKAMLRVSGLIDRLEVFESLESFTVGQPVSVTLGAYTGFGKVADRGMRERYLVALNEPYQGETGFWVSAPDIAAIESPPPVPQVARVDGPVQTSPFRQVAEASAAPAQGEREKLAGTPLTVEMMRQVLLSCRHPAGSRIYDFEHLARELARAAKERA